MSLLEAINSSENNYKIKLEDFFIRTWGETFLYSHGIDHHRRVWHYAKELILAGDILGTDINTDKLIISCYLHDLGMSLDPGIHHGISSMKLCKSFLKEHNLDESGFHDLLLALEHHDDKEYKIGKTFKNGLLNILSVADDLDAFGYIGVYRYLEIYLARGINPEILGNKIRENAFNRYRNFEINFGDNTELIQKHKKRYLILDDFFNGYNRFSEKRSSLPDYSGIINVVSDVSRGIIPLKDLSSRYLSAESDTFTGSFIIKLKSELSEF